MQMEIELEGFEELERRLAALPARIERRVFRVTLRSVADKLKRRIAPAVPYRTGTARKALQTKVSVRRGGAYAVVRFRRQRRPQHAALYMRMYERGTRRQPPRPFFYAASGDWQREVVSEFQKGIREVLSTTEGQLAGA